MLCRTECSSIQGSKFTDETRGSEIRCGHRVLGEEISVRSWFHRTAVRRVQCFDARSVAPDRNAWSRSNASSHASRTVAIGEPASENAAPRAAGRLCASRLSHCCSRQHQQLTLVSGLNEPFEPLRGDEGSIHFHFPGPANCRGR